MKKKVLLLLIALLTSKPAHPAGLTSSTGIAIAQKIALTAGIAGLFAAFTHAITVGVLSPDENECEYVQDLHACETAWGIVAGGALAMGSIGKVWLEC